MLQCLSTRDVLATNFLLHCLHYSEQESGKDTNRPILDKMLNSIRPNDEVIIPSLDRLSRNYKDSKEIIQITKDKRKEYFSVTLKIFLA